MKNLYGKLTYANPISTLCLFLLLGGATAFAASKLAKKSVGSNQLKSNAVTAKKIKKNAVTSAKLKANAVTNAKLADGAVNFAKIATGTNVIASATGGPVSAKQTGPVNVPLSAPLVVTPVAGQPITLDLEARGTLAQTGASSCTVNVLPLVNGNPLPIGELFVLQSPGIPPRPGFPNGLPQADIAFPVGLTQPGKLQNITLEMFGSTECTSASTLDQVAIVATQAK
jgi:hypothetical protein